MRSGSEVLFVDGDTDHAAGYADAAINAGYRARVVAELDAKLTIRTPAICICATLGNAASSIARATRALPLTPVVAWADVPTVEAAVASIRHGAVDYVSRQIAKPRLVEKIVQHARAGGPGNTVIASAGSRRTFELAARVARTDVSVLINGESGTGKEVVARFIHERSLRCDGPFVAINCAAIPDQMLEAILFGHEKGAFTGATKTQPGKFELADGGTLLLDEITEMPLGLQAKLLRVLQEREVERVGGAAPRPVNVRVIATTNRTLEQEMRAGRFREDLYYRLSVFPLELLPLRERRADVSLLVDHFFTKYGGGGRLLTPDAERAVAAYEWPGNVRELENVIQRALVMSDGGALSVDDLGLSRSQADRTLTSHVRNAEDSLVMQTLKELDGNRRATAAALGVSERTLRYKIARLRELGVFEDTTR